MRTLKLALATVAAFAFNANAATPSTTNGMGLGVSTPPAGQYQAPVIAGSRVASDGLAFHAGGVAACDGCHVMHNASSGVAKSTLTGGVGVAAWSNVTNMFLLQGSDQSSTCLICHQGNTPSGGQQFTVADLTTAAVPANRTPAGDFGWLAQSFTNSPGARHGHNVVAGDWNLQADTLLTAPGGSFTVTQTGKTAFACSNCHDPHGRYRMVLDNTKQNGVAFKGPEAANSLPIASSGSYGQEPTATYAVGAYRLLGGQGYAPVSNAAFPFPNDPPVAVAPAIYNNNEGNGTEVRVAYGTGMSEWCQNCHTNVHFGSDTRAVGIAGFRHPAGSDATLAANQIRIYNTYLSSGRMDPSLTSNYTSLVPFEQGKNKNLATLRGNTGSASIIAADSSSNVMCLSCHRAHATAFDSMVRWDQNATFLTNDTAFTAGVTNRSAAQTTAGYYGRSVGTAAGQIGPYQRSLCNKCHGKD